MTTTLVSFPGFGELLRQLLMLDLVSMSGASPLDRHPSSAEAR